MENPMNLHNSIYDFNKLIKETADFFGIRDLFIEKDYWITLVLYRLAESKYNDSVVFKGGTSLSKGYKLINRFSEDVDIAVINSTQYTGNQLKTLIRNVEKTISKDLSEIVIPEVTSKGSQFRKSVFNYPETNSNKLTPEVSNTLLIEINSFANPFPNLSMEIKPMISELLEYSKRYDLTEQFGLKPFKLHLLDKKQTLIEKIASLIRFSFSEDPKRGISEKIRHFYDIYYLLNDSECKNYFASEDSVTDLTELIQHDRMGFDEPSGWSKEPIRESPILQNFDAFWASVKSHYTQELSLLAYSEIPDEKEVSTSFKQVIDKLIMVDI